MVQICFKNMHFHDKEGVIPYNPPSNVFLQARAVNLFLDTQKNSAGGDSTTMEATNLKYGNPFLASASRFLHLHQHYADPDTPICSYFPATGASPKSVISTKIISLLRLHASTLGL